MSLEHRLKEIRSKINEATIKSSRRADEIKLLVVTKTWPTSVIKDCFSLGLKSFAENYTQEALPKIHELAELNLEWHFIGKIQTNKIKEIVGKFHLIHSVDRLKVLDEISKKSNETQRVLIQVNIASEATKGGVPVSEMEAFIDKAQSLSSIQLCGLMVMPPIFPSDLETRESSKKFFDMTAKLRHNLEGRLSGSHHLKELSMGTSVDFEEAISMGSTIIRVGTALLGERSKHV